eukprot:12854264-Alexandrium_andersonii.AAC.1
MGGSMSTWAIGADTLPVRRNGMGGAGLSRPCMSRRLPLAGLASLAACLRFLLMWAPTHIGRLCFAWALLARLLP